MNKLLIDSKELIRSIVEKGNVKIISTDKDKYVIKEKIDDLLDYNYLNTKGFVNYVPIINKNNKYNVFKYIEDKSVRKEDKGIDLVLLMSILHNKTTVYKEVNLDDIKSIYEERLNLINYLKMYYEDIQDYIERKIYMAPGEYLLMRHISEIYLAINYSYEMLEKWYEEKKNKKKERIVQLHNNLSIDHLIQNENNYLISWDKSNSGLVIYDFVYFYKNDYLNLEMNSLFDIYQSKYKYDSCEMNLFLSIIALPWKIDFKDSNLDNCTNVLKLVKYVIKTREFILKENEKYQEAN